MSTPGSVSQWIEELKTGQGGAATRLWDRYYGRLMQYARRRMNGAPRRVSDEEDLVIAAFQSFFHRAADGQFPALDERSGLWGLLVKITERKAVNAMRHRMTEKRGGGRELGESAAGWLTCGDSDGVMARAEDSLPSPFALAAMAELLNSLDDELRQIVTLRCNGMTYEEIARRINRSVATVERRLKLIRDRWEKELLG